MLDYNFNVNINMGELYIDVNEWLNVRNNYLYLYLYWGYNLILFNLFCF